MSSVFLHAADDCWLSYGDLRSQTARIANLLRRLGAKPGDRIAAQVDKSVEAVLLYLGCLRAGCVFLPLNPAYQAGELRHLLGDAKPTVFVARPQGLDQVESVRARPASRMC